MSQGAAGLTASVYARGSAACVDCTENACPAGATAAGDTSEKVSAPVERMRSAEFGRTATVRIALPVALAESVTVTPSGKLPVTVGVPVRMPFEASVRPAGSAPLVAAHVYGATPPMAASICCG